MARRKAQPTETPQAEVEAPVSAVTAPEVAPPAPPSTTREPTIEKIGGMTRITY